MALIKFFIISIFISCISLSSAKVTPMISDSQDADIAELPYLVSIQFRFITISSHICTGILLSENFVLSSGQCLSNRALANLKIEFGQTIITPGNQTVGQKASVRDIIFHPLFNSTGTQEHDLCLIQSNDTMVINNLIQPYANLATPNSRYLSGTRALHASWGQVSPGVTSYHLQRADLRLISMTECIQKINGTKLPYRESICALEMSVLCTGDIGAPLLVNRIVVGVASFRNGPICTSVPGMFPNVYTAVSFYIGWIEAVTGITYQINTFLSRNL